MVRLASTGHSPAHDTHSERPGPRLHRWGLLLALSLGLSIPLDAAQRPAPNPSPSPAARGGQPNAAATVIPDRLLRRWDPVTVFFGHDAGPAKGGPEDHPERFVTMKPSHPGAFTWIDARTLQFRPAEPWPSLERISWTVEGRTTTLRTLMEAPVETVPAATTEGLEPVSEIALVFAEPLAPEALARMVTIELRPLPGIDAAGARRLSRDDFEVKVQERRARTDRASYVLVLRQPIPLGTRAIVRLRLTLDDRDSDSFRDIAFSTAEPFRVLKVGCRERTYPVSPEGTRYTREQALSCPAAPRTVVVEFSSTPQAFDVVQGRNLVRLTPAVANVSFALEGKTLAVTGDFARDTLYSVALAPSALKDARGRALDIRGRSEVFLHFLQQDPFVRLGASQGFVERQGPQMVPVQGRGQERVDVRILPIPPLDRSFWPFPPQPVVIDESQRPPGPGEARPPHTEVVRPVYPQELADHIRTLGSPPVSALLTLPTRRDGSAASFGLDLQPHLAKIAGKGAPGTYLVGLRDLASGTQRSWMRLQVTDLCLSTVEEPRRVRFVVTSLSSGQPLTGARVKVEGTEPAGDKTAWVVITEGVTDVQGAYTWDTPGGPEYRSTVERITVAKDGDLLVLDPKHPPEVYADNQWSTSYGVWLDWTRRSLDGRGPQPETVAHIFTERPVYRPEESVHIKGYLRVRAKGHLKPLVTSGHVVVEGPGDLVWRYPVSRTEGGSFYHRFSEKDLPTGVFAARFEDANGTSYGRVTFRVEAYRIPRFEVTLHAPEHASLDEAFTASLTATYYAGGRVAAQPVQWRVTQFPYDWTPKRREGFLYSSDARFSRTGRFESTATLERTDVTDESGGASLRLDPTIEPTASPRRYVVEATVTGADDQTVTASRSIPTLPPFVIGIKAPRYLERARTIDAEVVVAGPDGTEVEGKPLSVRLLRREWHSHLRASDFSDGVARYQTDVVDVPVSEAKIQSGSGPLPVHLPIDRAGVWVIQVEGQDRLGRAQVVSTDLYAGGEGPVAWSKPVTKVFAVSTDKAKYDPGAMAQLVLQSPFQSARALAIVEAPEGNRYRWIDVVGGAATFPFLVEGHFTPRIPVHFVLMRGRIAGTAPLPGNNTDVGKPATMAATAWVTVNPIANQVNVELAHPESARPGQKVDVRISLKDPKGAPLPGEVTLWLVDQAVLALGREQRLDPVPDFITPVRSHLEVRDTRNDAFGALPFLENPGGDEGEGGEGLLDKATVRKNFQPVPYYNPAIAVGPDGTTLVTVQLPDDLTNFKVRAKAASGPERFGFGTGQIAVRLPVIVQPSLPRFTRPGDSFTAVAIGRVVEGKGGPGSAEIQVKGAQLKAAPRKELTWVEGRPERIEFPVEVPTPAVNPEGRLTQEEVRFKMAVGRRSDGATDAFEVAIPIRDDRDRVTQRLLKDLAPGETLAVPAVGEAVRAGTLRRTVLLSDQPGLIRMAAGLSALMRYPYGCTEQQLSRARAYLALRRFRDVLQQSGGEKDVDRAVKGVLEWLPTVVDSHGLVAYWPAGPGYVSLTAWVVDFLVEAKEAGFAVDDSLLRKLTATLEQALRSDYGRFIDAEAYTERAFALGALTHAGQDNPAYAAELARRATFLNLESKAQVLQALGRTKPTPAAADSLGQSIWDGVVVRLHQGREIYGGLQDTATARNALVLPSETRTLAEVTRALARQQPSNPRLAVLVDALVTLGRDDGWGSTNADAAALLALTERLKPAAAAPALQVRVRLDGQNRTVDVGGTRPLASVSGSRPEAGEVATPPLGRPIVARVETSYVPEADGGQAAAVSAGFVVSRALLRVRQGGAPPERIPLDAPATTQTFDVGEVVEEHVRVVNPRERHYVAVVVPLAAGMEPLNPALATAPPEAQPAGRLTKAATFGSFKDDQVAFYFDTLPAGTFDFYFRTRATVPGRYIQPPAKAEMMYDAAVRGTSPGARVVVAPK